MGKTLYWRIIPDGIVIAVHTHEPPTDEEWDTYLQEVTKHVHNVKGVLVYAESAGPTAPQRARVNAAYADAGVSMKTAIMSGSRLVRGVVTAMSWTLAENIKAFSTSEFDQATAFLGLDAEDSLKARVVLKQLGRAAGVSIEAFADESGRFARKYK